MPSEKKITHESATRTAKIHCLQFMAVLTFTCSNEAWRARIILSGSSRMHMVITKYSDRKLCFEMKWVRPDVVDH
ncbi:hypothetical protein RM53_00965 [Brevundimonas nasdae]|uniref:Uncharacterized protein n=1 Tax=Brevundimonas nasdae TaxID=172043 RepID=A0A0B4E290_9CAUL|nr:hypothetical protein RM53_00965 [Brevundimonas nasdae]